MPLLNVLTALGLEMVGLGRVLMLLWRVLLLLGSVGTRCKSRVGICSPPFAASSQSLEARCCGVNGLNAAEKRVRLFSRKSGYRARIAFPIMNVHCAFETEPVRCRQHASEVLAVLIHA